MNKEKINKRMREHWNEVVKYIGDEKNIIGLFLIGSQNYRTDTKTSDIDTRAIVFPTLDDIIHNREAKSTTLHLSNGEQITVVDVRLFIDRLKKQNINYLEVLFTQYDIINVDYADLWIDLLFHREKIAHYDTYKVIAMTAGTFKNKNRDLTHKKLSELFRLRDFLYKYLIEKTTFKDALYPKDIEFVKAIKMGEKYEEDLFHIIAAPLEEEIASFMEIAKQIEVDEDNKKEVEKILYKFQQEIMIKYLKDELQVINYD